MREFILLSLKGSTFDFEINDKTESGLVCRVIANTFWVSRGIRPDTVLHVVLNGPPHSPKIITFTGSQIQDLPFDEKSVAKIVRHALNEGKDLKMHETKDVNPGIKVAKESFEWLVQDLAKKEIPLFYLHKKGDDIRTTPTLSNENIAFIFGDLFGIPQNTEKLLKRLNANRITLGPTMLFASHCPIIVHNELDRKERNWTEE